MFHWPYFTLVEGDLYEDVGTRQQTQLVRCFKDSAPKFANAAEAEAWLVANDHRGSVR
jgi:hypothetical protein